MKKKSDDSAAHELRDRPVPPVKGTVTVEQDAQPRPEQFISGNTVSMGDSGALDSWL